VSATNRGTKRRAGDFYETPAWLTRLLLAHVDLPGGTWLEPAAGNGAIIRAVNSGRFDIDWHSVEIRKNAVPTADELLHPADFLTWTPPRHYDLIISNPPYDLAQPFIEKSLTMAPLVVMLLRLNYLASKKRCEFFQHRAPDVYTSSTRPSFAVSLRCDGKRTKHRMPSKGLPMYRYRCNYARLLTHEQAQHARRTCPKCGSHLRRSSSDACDYAWYVWHGTEERREGIQRVLPCVPAEELVYDEETEP
jgi:hypothetical protein